MPDSPCTTAAADKTGDALQTELEAIAADVPTMIFDGATDFPEFEKQLVADHGERFRGYARSLWDAGVPAYEKMVKGLPSAPKVTDHSAELLPDYDHTKHQDTPEVLAGILDSISRLAKRGEVRPIRGGIDSKLMSQTALEADKIGVGKVWTRDELRKAGVSLEVATQVLSNSRAYHVDQANQIAEAISKIEAEAAKSGGTPAYGDLKIRYAQALTLADISTLETLGNATELGRALKQLQFVTSVLKSGSQTATEHFRLFPGVDNSGKLTMGTLTPEQKGELLKEGERAFESSVKAQRGKRKPRISAEGMLFPGATPAPVEPVIPKPKAPRKTGLSVASIREAYKANLDQTALSKAMELKKLAWEKARIAFNTQALSGFTAPPKELVDAWGSILKIHLDAMGKTFKNYKSRMDEAAWSEFHSEYKGEDDHPVMENASRQAWVKAGGRLNPRETVDRIAYEASLKPRTDVPQAGRGTNAEGVLGKNVSGVGTTVPGVGPGRTNVQKRLDVGLTDTPKREGWQAGTEDAITGEGATPGQMVSSVPGMREATPRERLTETSAKQTGDLPARGTGEAPTLYVDSDGQLTSPEAGASESKLFLPDRAQAIIDSLRGSYEPPTVSTRDPKTLAKLTELGGYFYSQLGAKGKVDYHEWAMNMHASVGKKVNPSDLIDAYQAMAGTSFSRVKKNGIDVRTAALKRAEKTLDPKEMQRALDGFGKIDPKSPDAPEEYAKVLKQFHKGMSGIHFAKELPGLWRAVKTSFDTSAPGRQAAISSIGSGLNPLATLSRLVPASSLQGTKLGEFLLREQREQTKTWRSDAMMLGLGSDVGLRLAKSLKLVSSDKKTALEFRKEVERELLARKNYGLYEQFKLPLTKVGGDTIDLTQREEAYMSNSIAEWTTSKKPLLRFLAKGIESSEYMYSGYLNNHRANKFDEVMDGYMPAGFTPEVYPDLYRATAQWIGDLTGRSENLGSIDLSDSILRATFFSARFQASRIKVALAPARVISSALLDAGVAGGRKLTGNKFIEKEAKLREVAAWGHFADMPAPLRKEVSRDMLRYAGIYATLASMAVAAGASVDLDPRSSDFLKIRFGNTRVDVAGGMLPLLRTFAVLLNHERAKPKANANTQGFILPRGNRPADITKIDSGKFGASTSFDVEAQYVRQKFAPVPATLMDMQQGTNMVGEKIWRDETIPGDIAKNVVPMWTNDIMDAYQNNPKEKRLLGVGLAFLATRGLGVQTYDEKKKRK